VRLTGRAHRDPRANVIKLFTAVISLIS
jgi:hypothetical protein